MNSFLLTTALVLLITYLSLRIYTAIADIKERKRAYNALVSAMQVHESVAVIANQHLAKDLSDAKN